MPAPYLRALGGNAGKRNTMTYLDTNIIHIERIDIENNTQQIDVSLETGITNGEFYARAHIEFVENENEIVETMTIFEAQKYVSALNEAIEAAKKAVEAQYKDAEPAT